MTYHYRAYGLNIESKFECPELMPGEGKPEVSLYNGPVPDTLENALVRERFFEAKPNRLLFRVDDVARYMVSNGNEIVVDRSPDGNHEQIHLFLLGSAFGALMHQRGLLPMHGSAIETSRGVVLFVGHTGAGKSTLAGAFHTRNYRVVTDDICVIARSSDGVPLAYPGYPEVRMTEDTTRRLNVNTSSLQKMVWRTKEKYLISVRERFSHTPLPLYAVYWLTVTDEQAITLTPVEGIKKFEVLVTNTYWKKFLKGLGGGANHFKLATAIAEHARITRAFRPREGFMLDELVDALEQDFR